MPDIVGVTVGLVMILALVLSGVPLFVGLGLGGLIGSLFFMDFSRILQSGYFVWNSLGGITLLAIPGFLLMGNLFYLHGFGKELFDCAYKWLGNIRGGLLLASTALGAGFGFISGSMAAGAATVGSIAIPEVERRGYDRRLSLGSIAIAGTLATLIPPSLTMILYAVLAEISLGKLFWAGLIPGILLSLLICIYVLIRTTLNKNLAPLNPVPVSFREKLISLKGVFPIALTFVIVFGGMYLGLWAALEAAAVGAVISVLLCIAYKRFTLEKFGMALTQTMRVATMVYGIIIAATYLNLFVFLSKLDQMMVGFMSGLNLPGWVVAVIVLIILSLLGTAFDVVAIIMISVPVFLPVIVSAGFDPIWFGVILCISSELAEITPPTSVGLFIIKDIAPKGTTINDVIVGVTPYVMIVWVLFALLIIFPKIATWLPSILEVS